MLSDGTEAPTVRLPAVVDGAIHEVDLSQYVGENIVVLAFYPADFSPACTDDACDLTELDLFTMQRDVAVFAIGPDSTYSHRRFAEAYSLSLPLLSDTYGEAAEAYGVRRDGDQLLAERAVFVIDQDGIVQYAWATDDLEERPDLDAVRAAVSDIGGDSTAVGRYRVGHAHYIEARRAFTSAMSSFEERDWLLAQGDFERAMEEFQDSADQFQSAARFAESDSLEAGFDRAQQKATALWQAAEWLADSASAYASGNGGEADELREDAESPLQTARDIGEPPNPDDITLDRDGTGTVESADTDDLTAPTDPADDDRSTDPGGAGDATGNGDANVDAAIEELEADGEAVDGATDGRGATLDGTEEPAEGSDGDRGADADADPGGTTDAAGGSDDGDDSDDGDVELDLTDPNE